MGLALGRNRAASACMDLSDGLADGVRQIAEASGVGMHRSTPTRCPSTQAARAWFDARGGDAVAEALTGGDDYELAVHRPPPGERPAARLPAGGADVARDPHWRLHGSARPDSRAVRATSPPSDDAIPSGYTHFR